MTQENQEELKKRLKSLGWRCSMMIVALVIDFALQNLGLFNLSASAVTIIGLVLGEISKLVNNKLSTKV